MVDSRPRCRGLQPHWRHCVVSLSKNISRSLVLFQPRKTSPYITERLLMGCKESNQTKITCVILKPFTSKRHLLKLFQTEQIQIRQLLLELPDQRLLCLLMKIWLPDPTLVDLISNFFVLCTNMKVYLYNYS